MSTTPSYLVQKWKILMAISCCAIIGYEVIPRKQETFHSSDVTERKLWRSLQAQLKYTLSSIEGISMNMHSDESFEIIEDRSLKSNAKKKRIRSPFDTSRITGQPPYGALSCPLEMSMFSNYNRAIGDFSGVFYKIAEESMKYSLSKNAPARIQSVANSGSLDNRRILFLGDSLTRHLFIALGCLTKKIKSTKIPWARWPTPHPNDKEVGANSGYDAARVRLSGGAELLYYHIVHNLLTPPNYLTPVIDNSIEKYSWINSCRRREPFYIHPGVIAYGNEENIVMTKNDVVVLNAGLHPGTRPITTSRFKELLTCVKEARQEGTANDDWPEFLYFVTPETHEADISSPYASQCSDEIRNKGDQRQDRKTFPSLVHSMIGEDFDWASMARYHVGYGDCVHYTQMGVHDVVAAELAEWIQNIDSPNNSTPPAPALSPVSPVSPPTKAPVKKVVVKESNEAKKLNCKKMTCETMTKKRNKCKKSPCCRWKNNECQRKK